MASPLVFITGGTGFIGSHVILSTLKSGYRVLLSIRKPEQRDVIIQRYPDYTSMIQTVVIPDMTKAEAFKEALNEVTFIFHLASPMPGSGSDVRRDYIDPAVQATEAVLYAALNFPQIKRVVVMSSALALLPVDAMDGSDVSVTDNTGEVIQVNLDEPFPDDLVGHGQKYAASKIFAHQATKDFLKIQKPHYILTTFHPVFVMGDSLIQKSAKDLDGINAFFWQGLFSPKPIIGTGWVHVRDVAEAHVKALEAPIETGTEFLLSLPGFPWEEAVDYIKAQYPNLGCKLEPPFEKRWTTDASTAERILKMQWRPREKIIHDVIDQQLSFQAGK
ncbi:hypothetical protein BP6252_05928 [Coleophoma cylindrospora]|uniref:NAD-dependent epimerase/dehydratase domain-containing protein n=1 Tax=Coleophoma cylindrospora TaxID=1849047 RepID=A0A3D8RLH7_9HELO|nr:hypothetical protein BP6252_05928 [Coleophoma cylindrospora]